MPKMTTMSSRPYNFLLPYRSARYPNISCPSSDPVRVMALILVSWSPALSLGQYMKAREGRMTFVAKRLYESVRKPEPATAHICQSKPFASMSPQIWSRLLEFVYKKIWVQPRFSFFWGNLVESPHDVVRHQTD